MTDMGPFSDGVSGLNGQLPHGSVAHDAELIGRLANELFRGGYVASTLPNDPFAIGRMDGPTGIDPTFHREQLLDSELLYRTRGPQGWPSMSSSSVDRLPLVSEPMSWAGPTADSLQRIRRSSAADVTCEGVDRAYRDQENASSLAARHEYYFLRDPVVPQPDRPSGPAIPEARWSAPYDPYVIRRDFPALQQRVHGKRLVWLDNAATTQKPQSVIDALRTYYERDNSNVHRGAHTLAARATDAFEAGREKVRAFLGAAEVQEIIFVRGTTEAINLVAQSYGRANVGQGDEVLVTELEHHSNIVPWQLLCQEKGATLRVVPINDRGEVQLDEYSRLLGPHTKIVAIGQVSNALGTIVPVDAMTEMAHAAGAVVLVDGAQAVPHLPVNVQTIGCDFYAFSGHKLFGPTGVGALWGRRELLESMPPWQGGGQMIKTVNFEESTFNDLPYKFEAGTGIIAGAVGLGAAIDYVTALGLHNIAAHEEALLHYGTAALESIPGVTMIGTSPTKAGVLSFVLDGMPTEEVGKFLDREGVAVRAGHHCAQPALRHFGLSATVRPSLGLYNTHDDIDVLTNAVSRAARDARGGKHR